LNLLFQFIKKKIAAPSSDGSFDFFHEFKEQAKEDGTMLRESEEVSRIVDREELETEKEARRTDGCFQARNGSTRPNSQYFKSSCPVLLLLQRKITRNSISTYISS
jgi:hypothetical protein